MAKWAKVTAAIAPRENLLARTSSNGLEETELWRQIASAMGPLLADPALKECAQGWPATVESAPSRPGR